MTMPTFWRRATFSVAETAEIIGGTEDGLRAWIARNPINDFGGAKTGGRLWLSGMDGFYYLLVQALSLHGVPVRTAMLMAATIANDAEDGQPRHRYLLARVRGKKVEFHHTDNVDALTETGLIVPLHELLATHIDRCAAAYVKEAS